MPDNDREARRRRNRSRFVWEEGDIQPLPRQEGAVEDTVDRTGAVTEGIPERLHRFLWEEGDVRVEPRGRGEDS